MMTAPPPLRDTNRLREALQQQEQGNVLLLDRQTRFVGTEPRDELPDMVTRLMRTPLHY